MFNFLIEFERISWLICFFLLILQKYNLLIETTNMMLVLASLFCVIVLPVLANIFADYEVLTILVVFLFPCACYASVVRSRGKISITCADVLVLLLLVYGCLSVGVIRHFQIDGLIYYEWVLMLIVYWIACMLDRRYWLLLDQHCNPNILMLVIHIL